VFLVYSYLNIDLYFYELWSWWDSIIIFWKLFCFNYHIRQLICSFRGLACIPSRQWCPHNCSYTEICTEFRGVISVVSIELVRTTEITTEIARTVFRVDMGRYITVVFPCTFRETMSTSSIVYNIVNMLIYSAYVSSDKGIRSRLWVWQSVLYCRM